MAASTFFIPSVNVIGADSLNDAMNMMADYGFTRTLIVTDNILTKLGMAGDVQKALKAVTMIAENLPLAVEDGSNAKAREAMAYAQFLAGMAFNNASLGYVHAMAHQLGGFYNLPHGVCNAVLLPHVQVFNSKVAAARLRDCAAAMGVNVTGKNDAEGAEACINAIRELAKKVDIPAGLRDLNVKEEDFAVLATNALKDACGFTNPIQATHEEIVAIYRAAM
ncbi:TPA: iron-containing alcohol dehydrogenase [Escherichia coli]|nr:iron-containing alcohol dehydrogenase [Escherichia coli]